MTTREKAPVETSSERDDDVDLNVNEVRLSGRLAAEPEEREMPSGDVMRTFRLVVRRPVPARGQRGSKQTVDTLECVVWSARVRRSCATWHTGDVIEVSGAMRRRFYRSSMGTISRVEVEVTSGRVIRRAAT